MIQSRIARRVIVSVFAVMVILAFLGFILTVYLRIQQGHAADTYDNVYGFHLTWAQAAASLASIALAFLVGWAFRWWQLWRRSRLEGAPTATILKDLK